MAATVTELIETDCQGRDDLVAGLKHYGRALMPLPMPDDMAAVVHDLVREGLVEVDRRRCRNEDTGEELWAVNVVWLGPHEPMH